MADTTSPTATDADPSEIDPAQADTKTVQGRVPELASDAERRAAFDEAFDYRGDITLETVDGTVIEGFIFDRRSEGDDPYVRIWPKDADERIDIPYRNIARLVFSGRDTAAGRSWETWMRKYYEKKAKGEEASIQSESLDDA